MKTIACTGGKGGTGKTFSAVNLAVFLALQKKKVLLIDCDVENPNTSFLLGLDIKNHKNLYTETVFKFAPVFDESKCTQCGECSRLCRPHAILQIKEIFPILMENLCSACLLCYKICPENAISDLKAEIGKIYYKKNMQIADNIHLDLLIGELNVGGVNSVKIIEKLFEYANDEILKKKDYDYIIADTSPGAHCDVQFVLEQCEYAVCVTEPTPFGAHDLKRILDLIKLMEKKAHVIINRYTMVDFKDVIEGIINDYGSSLLGKIPLDQKILASYSRGIPFIIYDDVPEDSESKLALTDIGKKILNNFG